MDKEFHQTLHDICVLKDLMDFGKADDSIEVSSIEMLDKVEKLYESFTEISASSHKKDNFNIAIFGSARLQSNTPEFQFIFNLSQAIVKKLGVSIVTGGGPGIMEAANQGAMQAILEAGDNLNVGKKPQNVGIRVHLPFEKKGNPYLHVEKVYKHFTTRLQSFVSLIQGAYIGPGGIGTLLELSLLMQMRQTNHLDSYFPIVATPKFWKPVLETFYDVSYQQMDKTHKLIGANDMGCVTFSDDIEEIVSLFEIAFQKWQETQNLKEA